MNMTDGWSVISWHRSWLPSTDLAVYRQLLTIANRLGVVLDKPPLPLGAGEKAALART
jgi:hypothetical protein